jgi:hypothetical protein
MLGACIYLYNDSQFKFRILQDDECHLGAAIPIKVSRAHSALKTPL